MGDRNAVAVDRARRAITDRGGLEVCHDLVAKQVEIDPCGVTAAFWAAEDITVEGPGGRQVVDRKC